MTRKPSPAQITTAALAADFTLFFGQLVDRAGQPLEVPPHLVCWADLIAGEPRLILRAPRGHGKSTLLLAYLAWCCWRHGRPVDDPIVPPGGPFEAVLFSATVEQGLVLMRRFRDLLDANPAFFASVLPDAAERSRGNGRLSAIEIRLRNLARLRIRSFGTSVRGMHPDLLLLDDVLNDENSLTSLQRAKTLRYFMGTLLPMQVRRTVIIGTAIHQADLLEHLSASTTPGASRHRTQLGFYAATFRAYDEATGQSLWPERFPPEYLLGLRAADPLAFSREFQNDPRDDQASLFPYELTQQAIVAGAGYTLGSKADRGDTVVMGVDLAISASAGADFTVAMVVAWNPASRHRRILDIRREKGLEFDAQVALQRELIARYGVTLGIVENNGFQGWLRGAIGQFPEGSRVKGDTTLRSRKIDLQSGIPALVFAFREGHWTIPSGDSESLRLGRQFQAELGAYGYLPDGRLAGVGEHDDMVMAAWFVEVAIQRLEDVFRLMPREEIVTMDDLGIGRVEIGDWDREWARDWDRDIERRWARDEDRW